MLATSDQIVVTSAQLAVLAVGVVLVFRLFGSAAARHQFWSNCRLRNWPISGSYFVLLLAAIFLLGTFTQFVVGQLFSSVLQKSTQHEGLGIVIYGLGFHVPTLLVWPLLHLFRRRTRARQPSLEAIPLDVPFPKLSWGRVFLSALATLFMAFPVLALFNLVWLALLGGCGIKTEPQGLVAIFAHVKSTYLLITMVVVACVVAPLNEELIFRYALYRYGRRFHSIGAMVASSVFFALLHFNLAIFAPLLSFGCLLCLAYEKTGDIRVSIVTHALFNLSTIIGTLAGLPQT